MISHTFLSSNDITPYKNNPMCLFYVQFHTHMIPVTFVKSLVKKQVTHVQSPPMK